MWKTKVSTIDPVNDLWIHYLVVEFKRERTVKSIIMLQVTYTVVESKKPTLANLE